MVKHTRPLLSFAAALLMASGLAGLSGMAAQAAQKGSTRGDLTFEKTETVNNVRGKTKVVTRTIIGVSHTADKGGPLDGTSVRCHMTLVIVEGSKSPAEGSGYCNGIGAAGDTWNMLLSGNENGGSWTFVDGTGKFDDIKGMGTWKHQGAARTGSESYLWQGEWELKN